MPPNVAPAAAEVVLDTNVLLDWLVFEDRAVQPLVRALTAGSLRWVATEAMWSELAVVLLRPFPVAWSRQASTALQRAAPVCHRVDAPGVAAAGTPRCSDASDQKFIDLAVSRPTRWLISRDKALLRLAAALRRRGVAVVRPEQWEAAERPSTLARA